MKGNTKLGKLPKGSVTLSGLELIQYLLIPSRIYSCIIYKGGEITEPYLDLGNKLFLAPSVFLVCSLA